MRVHKDLHDQEMLYIDCVLNHRCVREIRNPHCLPVAVARRSAAIRRRREDESLDGV